MNKVFSIGQVVRVIGVGIIGKIVNVNRTNRNNDIIYQLQIPNDPYKRWFLAEDLELFHHMELA